jgi:hypothetical protein
MGSSGNKVEDQTSTLPAGALTGGRYMEGDNNRVVKRSLLFPPSKPVLTPLPCADHALP